MAYYKVRNITNTLPKRHQSKDRPLAITYNVGFIPKIYNLTIGDEMISSCNKLPTNIHKLRAKKLVMVQEISENEFLKNQRPKAKKQLEPVVAKKSKPRKKKVVAKLISPDIVSIVPDEKEVNDVKSTTTVENKPKRKPIKKLDQAVSE